MGVTLWELFENAAQPYPHLSDREVLNHVIREQQIKLLKPQLELPYSDRWSVPLSPTILHMIPTESSWTTCYLWSVSSIVKKLEYFTIREVYELHT